MKKQIFRALLLFFAVVLTSPVAPAKARSAPGDFLFLWGAQQHFSNPSGVAVDDNGDVYVTDTSTIQVFNSSGIRIRKWGSYGSGDGQLSYPKGITLDGYGRVYVVDSGNNRVQVFDRSGKFLFKWRHDWWGGTLNDIAIDRRGNVYVTDLGSFEYVSYDYQGDSVKVFDREGNFLRHLGSHGPGDGQYRGPTSVAVDVNGNVYLGDAYWKLQMFTPAGNFVKVVTESVMLNDIAVDTNGDVYVAGGLPYEFSVLIFDVSGNLIRELEFSDYYWAEHYWIPVAVAVDRGGNAYVLDYENDGLRAFDRAGNLLSQWWSYGTGDAQLDRPLGLAVDSRGKVYETDGYDEMAVVSNDRVRVFDSGGGFIRKWTAQVTGTSGIALDDDGRVYLLEATYSSRDVGSSVQIFDSLGNFLRKWGSYGSDPGQLLEPFGIAVTKSGNVLVTDTGSSRVDVFDNAGNFLKHLGTDGTGNGQFINPEGIAIDRSGNIFVVDTGNSRVQLFDSAYNFVAKWGGPGFSDGLFVKPSGIAVDARGHVFVADTGNNRVQVFDSAGNFLLKWGVQGDEKGQFNEPRGVAVDKTGARVYAADTGNNRIQVFQGYGAAPRSCLKGTVRRGSATGPVLAGAEVTIDGKTVTTSSTGAFCIRIVPAGSYTFTISKTGYLTKTVTGYFLNGGKSGLSFYLAVAPK